MLLYCTLAVAFPMACLGGSSFTPKDTLDYGSYCGQGNGSVFDDESHFTSNGYPTYVEIRADNVIDSIQIWYGGVAGPKHGGDGGDLYSFHIPEGEYISGIRMREGKESSDDTCYVVCQITFEVQRPASGQTTVWGPYGRCQKEDEDCGEYQSHTPMTYIKGRSESLLDYLHAIFEEI